ncbi:MAG: BACON domain-containing protein, partial [Candidatus Azobacteroides sp.]|nr:BACON domain-containing protein [Candidatus Azobacteroides sp.]
MQTSKWYPLYKFDIYVGDVEPQTPTLSIDPVSLQFNEDGESKEVRVTITNQSDASYSVTGLPSWLTVGNKTQTGFTLTADPSDTDMPRSVTLTVKSDAYPGASASLSVTQEGAWLSEFVFDVKTTAINQDIPR